MDWDNEPEPFRFYDVEQVIRLPVQEKRLKRAIRTST